MHTISICCILRRTNYYPKFTPETKDRFQFFGAQILYNSFSLIEISYRAIIHNGCKIEISFVNIAAIHCTFDLCIIAAAAVKEREIEKQTNS